MHDYGWYKVWAVWQWLAECKSMVGTMCVNGLAQCMAIVGRMYINDWQKHGNGWENVLQWLAEHISLVGRMYINDWQNVYQ